jgi:lysophospholipase L1-like esterase
MKRLGLLGVASLVSLIVTLGLVEVIGRWFFAPLLVRYSSHRALNLQLVNPQDLGVAGLYVPHHYYLYETRPSYRSLDAELRHNSRGCRAEEVALPKPESVVRIVAVGGSTTYSTLVRQNTRIYTYQLETLLNRWATAQNLGRRFEVLNCGVPGATSAENLSRYIFMLSEYQPDLLLVQQGVNDALARRFPHLSRDYREYSKTWDESYLEPRRWFIARVFRAVRNKFSDSIWNKGISVLVRRNLPDEAPAENYERNGPQIFEANTRYLVRLAAGDGTAVLLLSEHVVTDRNVHWRRLPLSRVRATLEHNEVLARLAESEKVLFFDLQRALCACPERLPDGRHLNEAGEREKAQTVFEYLTGRGIMNRWLMRSRGR